MAYSSYEDAELLEAPPAPAPVVPVSWRSRLLSILKAPRTWALLNICGFILTMACFIYVSQAYPGSIFACSGIVAAVATLGVLANSSHLATATYMWESIFTNEWRQLDTSSAASSPASTPLLLTGSVNGSEAEALKPPHARVCAPCTSWRVMKGFVCGVCVLTVLPVYAAGILAVWLKNGTTAVLSDNISIPGLHGAVQVTRDAHSVPHIVAGDEHDVYMAQGYVHAQMRLWQMEFNRRVGAGRLAEVAGEAALDVDRVMRTLGMYNASLAVYAALQPRTQAALDAYTAGVNAYIGRVTAGTDALPLEYRVLGFTPQQWVAADSIVWAKVMSYDLSGNMDRELTRFKLFSVQNLSVARVNQLVPPFDTSRFPTILSSADITPPYTPTTSALHVSDAVLKALTTARELNANVQARARMLRGEQAAPPADACGMHSAVKMHRSYAGVPHAGAFRVSSRFGASNNWVVGGNRTASGAPLLCNDPHLQLMAPSIWFLAHLQAKDGSVNTVGATFPGVPGVVIGRNDFIAWGVTNTGADVQDTYIVTVNPADASQYAWNGGFLPFDTHVETIRVSGSADVPITIRKTRHGPIITDNNFITGYNVPLALRWTTIDPSVPDTTLDAFLNMMGAHNYTAFRSALSRYVAPSQNFIYADVMGNIGYQMPGRIPIRNASVGHTGAWPAPGNNSSFEWLSFIPFDSLPRTFNPPEGYIATANNQVVPPNFPIFVSSDWDEGSDGYRAQRIGDMIRAQGQHTRASMAAIQQDYASYLSRDMLAIAANVSAAAFNTAAGQGLRARLQAWDGVMSIGSQEATLFAALFSRLATLPTKETGQDTWSDFVYLYYALASDASGTSDPACIAQGYPSCAAFMAATFDATAAAFGLDSNGNGRAPGWGTDVHKAVFTHQLLGASLLACLANRATSHGGDDSSVNVGHFEYSKSAGPGDAYTQIAGPSYRHIVDLGAPESSWFLNPMGQDGALFSTHYDDLVAPWSGGSYLSMVMNSSSIAATAASSQTLTPA